MAGIAMTGANPLDERTRLGLARHRGDLGDEATAAIHDLARDLSTLPKGEKLSLTHAHLPPNVSAFSPYGTCKKRLD